AAPRGRCGRARPTQATPRPKPSGSHGGTTPPPADEKPSPFLRPGWAPRRGVIGGGPGGAAAPRAGGGGGRRRAPARRARREGGGGGSVADPEVGAGELLAVQGGRGDVLAGPQREAGRPHRHPSARDSAALRVLDEDALARELLARHVDRHRRPTRDDDLHVV